MLIVALAVAGVLAVVVVALAVRGRGLQRELEAARARAEALSKYQGIVDAEAHAAQLIADGEKKASAAVAEAQETVAKLDKVLLSRVAEREYAQAKSTYDRLRAEVALLEENIEDISFGLYKPHYTFESSADYKAALDRVYEQKKALIRNGMAARCAVDWTVGGSKQEGARMTKQNIKVMLRAFNGEVDAAVAKVTWNNVTKMEERIRKSFESINSSGTTNQTFITIDYLNASLDELRLTYEYEVKKHDEQEEQRAIRERMREEEKARREFERAEKEAADDEARYEKALAKARAEVERASGAELGRVNEKVKELEAKLAEAHEKMERAKSMAELTRQGYVYVLSNIGSFGDDVYKIGMTRRLDPMDRVKELSDASVPFEFDVHAMVFSDDAPALENAFHREFTARRVNLVNQRKEYFKVSLAELEAFAASRSLKFELTKLAEAKEYRETLAIRETAARISPSTGATSQPFPDVLPLPGTVGPGQQLAP